MEKAGAQIRKGQRKILPIRRKTRKKKKGRQKPAIAKANSEPAQLTSGENSMEQRGLPGSRRNRSSCS